MKTGNGNSSEARAKLISILAEECEDMSDVQNTLKELFKDTMQSMLEGELEDHLGYEKHSVAGNNSGNSRNGYGQKTIKTEYGETTIEVPRDRNGEFEPQIIGKRQTRTEDLENRCCI